MSRCSTVSIVGELPPVLRAVVQEHVPTLLAQAKHRATHSLVGVIVEDVSCEKYHVGLASEQSRDVQELIGEAALTVLRGMPREEGLRIFVFAFGEEFLLCADPRTRTVSYRWSRCSATFDTQADCDDPFVYAADLKMVATFERWVLAPGDVRSCVARLSGGNTIIYCASRVEQIGGRAMLLRRSIGPEIELGYDLTAVRAGTFEGERLRRFYTDADVMLLEIMRETECQVRGKKYVPPAWLLRDHPEALDLRKRGGPWN